MEETEESVADAAVTWAISTAIESLVHDRNEGVFKRAPRYYVSQPHHAPCPPPAPPRPLLFPHPEVKTELINAALSPSIAEVQEALAEADTHDLIDTDEAIDAQAWLVALKHEYEVMDGLSVTVEALKGSRGIVRVIKALAKARALQKPRVPPSATRAAERAAAAEATGGAAGGGSSTHGSLGHGTSAGTSTGGSGGAAARGSPAAAVRPGSAGVGPKRGRMQTGPHEQQVTQTVVMVGQLSREAMMSPDGERTKLAQQLRHSATVGAAEELRLLTDVIGLDVDQPAHNGRTALHLAAMWGRLDILKMLLARGAR